MNLDELVSKSLEHARAAEKDLNMATADLSEGFVNRTVARAGVHATLSEAYARLASALIVQRTSNAHLTAPFHGIDTGSRES